MVEIYVFRYIYIYILCVCIFFLFHPGPAVTHGPSLDPQRLRHGLQAEPGRTHRGGSVRDVCEVEPRRFTIKTIGKPLENDGEMGFHGVLPSGKLT